MTVTVLGIVLGIGVPSFWTFQRTNAMAAATNDLVTGALLARSEAVKRQVPVTLCLSPNPTMDPPSCGADETGGFVVFVDENGNGSPGDATDGNAAVDAGEVVLLRRAAPGGSIRVWADADHVTYGRSGFPRDAAGGAASATRILLCDDRGNRLAMGSGSAARVVLIDATGRGTAREERAVVTAASAALDAACE